MRWCQAPVHDLRRSPVDVNGMRATGWECAVCGATRDIAEPFPWRCVNSSPTDRRHVLRLRWNADAEPMRVEAGSNPFVAFDSMLAWAAFAEAHGMSLAERTRLVETLDAAVAEVDGQGFRLTPFGRSERLSNELGFTDVGGVWVKDETRAVGGSHKARHLMTILLHLLAAESVGLLDHRPPLAIASCGNAAIAAATLARAARWPIEVYVPTWMSDAVGERLESLGAGIHRCERAPNDPPGDPAMLRFRDAVEAGAIPFTVQGPENALCLDGGRAIGWEIAAQARSTGTDLNRVFVQVGGGAFATCMGDGLHESGCSPTFHAVQAEGAAPLPAAWERAGGTVGVSATEPLELAGRWSEIMQVWENPTSLADGILDDETYDWIGVFEAMRRSGGSPVVASEDDIERAQSLAVDAGFDTSATGSAGLAGLLAMRNDVDDTARVCVVMSGVAR